MKYIFSLLFLLPVISWAQNPIVIEKPIVCNWITEVLENLKDNYREEPIWIGEDSKSRYSLFVNPKNGQFTIVQFNSEIACILGAGHSSFSLPSKPTL